MINKIIKQKIKAMKCVDKKDYIGTKESPLEFYEPLIEVGENKINIRGYFEFSKIKRSDISSLYDMKDFIQEIFRLRIFYLTIHYKDVNYNIFQNDLTLLKSLAVDSNSDFYGHIMNNVEVEKSRGALNYLIKNKPLKYKTAYLLRNSEMSIRFFNIPDSIKS